MANDKISVVGTNIAKKATMIWNAADMLRGSFKPHEYGLVILPMTVVKRFHSHGITDFRLRLYWPEFKNIKVCFPPIEEQQEIADFIDEKATEIDCLIKKKEYFLVELESYKKSLIYEYVIGKKEVPA